MTTVPCGATREVHYSAFPRISLGRFPRERLHDTPGLTAAAGRGLILISSEIEEVMAMSDRLLVMSQGEIVAEFARAELSKEAILRAAFRELEAA